MNALEIVQPEGEGKKKKSEKQEEIDKVVTAWKLKKNIPIEGARSKGWDQANYGRAARSAKNLIAMFGDWRKAVECIEYVSQQAEVGGYSCTLETVVRKADDFFEYLAGKGE